MLYYIGTKLERMIKLNKEGMDLDKVKVKNILVPNEAPPINAGTLTRLVLFVVAIINTVALSLGYDVNINLDGDILYEGVSLVLDLVIFSIGFWKNNNVSKKARIKEVAAKQVIKK